MKNHAHFLILLVIALGCAEKSPYREPELSQEIQRNIDCLERAAPRAHQSYERYLSWVDPDTGPTCEERHINYGLYPLYANSIAKCDHAAEMGVRDELPFPAMEQAVVVFAKANAELIPLAGKASAYYLQGQYTEDDCAQGKALHSRLIALFKQHQASERKVYDEIKKVKAAAKAYAAQQAQK